MLMHTLFWPCGNKYFMFALQSELTSLCVYVLQIFSAPPAKSALPPSDGKALACVILARRVDERKVTVGVHVCVIYLCQHVFCFSYLWMCVSLECFVFLDGVSPSAL